MRQPTEPTNEKTGPVASVANKDASEEGSIVYYDLTFSTTVIPPSNSAELDIAPPCPSLSGHQNPFEWTPTRKIFVTWLSCLSTVVTTYTPGAYTAGLTQYKAEWGITTTDVYSGITTFTLFFAFAPMILAPFSETYGRRPVFLTAGVVYVVSQLGSAVTRSFAGMLATRAIAGISCSVFSTIVGGVLSDIYSVKERNTAMAIFSGAALSGTGIGPAVSGVMAQHLSWRWIFYLQTITCGLVITALFFFFPETRGGVLLSRKARILNAWNESLEKSGYCSVETANTDTAIRAIREKETDTPGTRYRLRWKVKADEERATLAVLIKTSLLRPIHLLFTESVVFWFSLWMAFAWSILYLTFEVLPLMFGRAYNFSSQANGLVFFSISIASVIATVVAIFQDRALTTSTSRLSKFTRRDQPEGRLFFACGESLLLPIGLFWLGATTNHAIPWIVPVLACGCITLGIFSVYLAVFNYLADTYQTYASSAIAAQSFTRNVFAACLPLATEPMFDALGFLGVGCLLGGIGLVLSAVPWVLMLWGPKIRKRSRIACKLAE